MSPKPAKVKWTQTGPKTYKYERGDLQAFIFGAMGRPHFWAWSVYFSGYHVSDVAFYFKDARRRAMEAIEKGNPL